VSCFKPTPLLLVPLVLLRLLLVVPLLRLLLLLVPLLVVPLVLLRLLLVVAAVTVTVAAGCAAATVAAGGAAATVAGAAADAALMVVVQSKTVNKMKMEGKKEKKNTYQAFITVRRPLVMVVYDCRHGSCKSSLELK
jgi:hypothetical protein